MKHLLVILICIVLRPMPHTTGHKTTGELQKLLRVPGYMHKHMQTHPHGLLAKIIYLTSEAFQVANTSLYIQANKKGHFIKITQTKWSKYRCTFSVFNCVQWDQLHSAYTIKKYDMNRSSA